MNLTRFYLGTLLCIIHIFASPLKASELDGKTITFSQLFEALTNHPPEMAATHSSIKNAINFKDITIRFDRKTDNYLDERFSKGGKEIIVPYVINFYDCHFDVEFWWLMRNIRFKEYVSFFNCEKVKAIFQDCVFEKTVRIYGSEFEFIHFDQCTFEHGFKQGRSHYSDYLKFTKCKFSVNPRYIDDSKAFDMDARLFFLSNRGEGLDLTVNQCIFSLPEIIANDSRFYVDLRNSLFTNLKFNENRLEVPVKFSESSIENQFESFECNFGKYILAESFNFNPANARVQWSSINNNRIAIAVPGTDNIINGNSVNALKDEHLFNRLISVYANFYAAFKSQGNRFGANACYNEWKDIETVYLAHILEESYTFQTYFNYWMNIFLKTFCDYGTNPIKAIEWSVWVMCFFGLIYLLFPGSTDYFNDTSLYKKIHQMLGYYTKGMSIQEIFRKESIRKETESKQHYQNFKTELEEHRDKIPFFFRMISFPFFMIERIYVFFIDGWYLLLDKMVGKWEHSGKKKKKGLKLMYSFIMLVTILFYLFIRIGNALMLSLNAFSTLGFGEVPVKGIARYLTVIEGFVGWFLLSIFSVALISQILQ